MPMQNPVVQAITLYPGGPMRQPALKDVTLLPGDTLTLNIGIPWGGTHDIAETVSVKIQHPLRRLSLANLHQAQMGPITIEKRIIDSFGQWVQSVGVAGCKVAGDARAHEWFLSCEVTFEYPDGVEIGGPGSASQIGLRKSRLALY